MKNRSLLFAASLAAVVSFSTRASEVVEREGLPHDAPRAGVLVTIDVSTNQAYLFRDGALIRKSAAATGSDKILRKNSRVWWFRTPRGLHQVKRKVKDPIWTKPDWAFIEEGKRVPPPDSPLRKERGTMGKYALDLGDRVMIHGTNDPKSIGRRVSHGCIRLPNAMLAFLWKEVPVGTPVYIFDSDPDLGRLKGSEDGINDLDIGL